MEKELQQKLYGLLLSKPENLWIPGFPNADRHSNGWLLSIFGKKFSLMEFQEATKSNKVIDHQLSRVEKFGKYNNWIIWLESFLSGQRIQTKGPFIWFDNLLANWFRYKFIFSFSIFINFYLLSSFYWLRYKYIFPLPPSRCTKGGTVGALNAGIQP